MFEILLVKIKWWNTFMVGLCALWFAIHVFLLMFDEFVLVSVIYLNTKICPYKVIKDKLEIV